MEKPITVVLVEDEPSECAAIAACIEAFEEMRLVGVTNNMDKALELTRDLLPDAVILDLELHKGSGTGLGYLDGLRKKPPAVAPFILVTTNNVSAITIERTRQLGADFIMLKSQADYSADAVVELLQSFSGTIRNTQRIRRKDAGVPPEPPAAMRQRLLSRVTTEMNYVGISTKAIGRKYLVDAILMLYEGIEGNICPVLAKKYQKSDCSVERAMQNAINSAWRSTLMEELLAHYTGHVSSAKGVPTLTDFIYYYAEKLKIEYEGRL